MATEWSGSLVSCCTNGRLQVGTKFSPVWHSLRPSSCWCETRLTRAENVKIGHLKVPALYGKLIAVVVLVCSGWGKTAIEGVVFD